MRLIIADTSPIFYLLCIKRIDVLPALFGSVLLPDVVQTELSHPAAPESVRRWAEHPPSWVEVRASPAGSDSELQTLGAGEAAAIALAVSIRADMILIDERKGASVALRKGFAVMGTLGILDRAAARGLLDLASAFDQLKATNFRYRQEMLDDLLKKHDRARNA